MNTPFRIILLVLTVMVLGHLLALLRAVKPEWFQARRRVRSLHLVQLRELFRVHRAPATFLSPPSHGEHGV